MKNEKYRNILTKLTYNKNKINILVLTKALKRRV